MKQTKEVARNVQNKLKKGLQCTKHTEEEASNVLNKMKSRPAMYETN